MKQPRIHLSRENALIFLFLFFLAGCAGLPFGEDGPQGTLMGKVESNNRLFEETKDPFQNSCRTTRWAGDRRKMFFLMDGRGTGGEHDGPDEVLALARKDALERVLRCSGERQVLESFYDNTYQSGGKAGQVLARDLFETLAAFSQDETLFRRCRVTEKSLICVIRIKGWIRTESTDPSFAIRSFGMGQRGILQEGDNLSVRFRLTRPARVYLFDVEEDGQANLLFPTPLSGRLKNPLPSGKVLTYPPPGSRTRLRVRVPREKTRTLERLVIIALRKGGLDLPEEFSPTPKTPEKLYPIGDFQKTVLAGLYRMSGPGRYWTMREIPFEIVRSNPP